MGAGKRSIQFPCTPCHSRWLYTLLTGPWLAWTLDHLWCSESISILILQRQKLKGGVLLIHLWAKGCRAAQTIQWRSSVFHICFQSAPAGYTGPRQIKLGSRCGWWLLTESCFLGREWLTSGGGRRSCQRSGRGSSLTGCLCGENMVLETNNTGVPNNWVR